MAVFSNPKSALSITGVNVFVGDIIRHITTVDDQLDRVCADFAKRIHRDARNLAPVSQDKDPGGLRDSITVRKLGKAEYEIGPEIPPAYHAHLVEYGVPSRGIAPQPFMRPAYERHQEAFVIACAKVAGF
jgi:HK97 gp10 family phage protein